MHAYGKQTVNKQCCFGHGVFSRQSHFSYLVLEPVLAEESRLHHLQVIHFGYHEVKGMI